MKESDVLRFEAHVETVAIHSGSVELTLRAERVPDVLRVVALTGLDVAVALLPMATNGVAPVSHSVR